MNNSIQISLDYTFEGKLHSLSMQINLDQIMLETRTFPSFYGILAKQYEIDTYSYEYEVMLGSSLLFHSPSGFCEQFLHDGVFDLRGFIEHWDLSNLKQQIQHIIDEEITSEMVKQDRGLEKALIRAYQLGKNG